MARGLGRGIEAFFPSQEENDAVKEIKITELETNPYQPRKSFVEESINELSQSIAEHGIIQPLIVRKSVKGYEIVAGERRFRAAKAANLKKIPVIIKELTDDQMMEIALIENLQREDLNPVEEAQAYRKLMQELNYTQEELSKRVGKSRPHIANHLRLLNLAPDILEFIANGTLTMGHGRAFLGLKSKEKLNALVQQTIKEQLNVRELEKLVQQLNDNVPRETIATKQNKEPFLVEKETALQKKYGTAVTIKKLKRKGKIEIEFSSNHELERILDLLER